MNRNTILGTIGLSLLLILGAMVSQQEASSLDPVKINHKSDRSAVEKIASNSTQISQLASASNGFGFDLFTRIRQQQGEANILVSPASIAIALGMMRTGTNNATKVELTKALQLDALDSTAIDLSYQQLIETLQNADSKLQLAIANSLWANQNITLKSQFVEEVEEFYQGKVSNLDFSDPQSKNSINDWVAKNTNNKISEIVDSVNSEDGVYLINAIYFKGNWSQKFDSNRTREQDFFASSGDSVAIPMMTQSGDYRYYQSDRFQAVRLPYGEKQELGMYIFLPAENSNLDEFNQQLTAENWQEWLSKMRSKSGNLTIPRFQIDYEVDLPQFLSALGVNQIFSPQTADFTAMTDASVAVDSVKHKTFLEVNEEGTEAAGVTSIGITITSAPSPTESFTMNVNRPFFFAIRDDITETILFMGNVVEPQ